MYLSWLIQTGDMPSLPRTHDYGTLCGCSLPLFRECCAGPSLRPTPAGGTDRLLLIYFLLQKQNPHPANATAPNFLPSCSFHSSFQCVAFSKVTGFEERKLKKKFCDISPCQSGVDQAKPGMERAVPVPFDPSSRVYRAYF